MSKERPYVLGLTGSIGTGKSTTAAMFQSAGIAVWDADKAVHELYSHDTEMITAMEEIAPDAVVDGHVDREQLKQLIKSKPDLLKQIEALVHPRVAVERNRFIEAAKGDLVVLDIPLLYEVGADALCDGVLVVTTTPAQQRRRVLDRGTMSRETFEQILSRQMPLSVKEARADFVVETISLAQTRQAVHDLIQQITNKEASDA